MRGDFAGMYMSIKLCRAELLYRYHFIHAQGRIGLPYLALAVRWSLTDPRFDFQCRRAYISAWRSLFNMIGWWYGDSL